MRRPLLLVATSTVLLLAACGGDDGDSSPTTSVATATTASAASTAPPDPTDPPATTEDAGGLEAALLTADDVGEGFVATPGDPGDPDDLTPCGTPSVQQVVPPADQVGVDLTNAEANLFLSQQVFAYADADEAIEAMAAGHEGLACGSGTSSDDDGNPIEFDLAEVTDPPEGLGDEAFAFNGTVTTGGQTVDTVFAAIRHGSAISTMTFISAGDSDGPPIGPILQTAADKLATVA
jgi:hypothetical protein